jgi:hypothetical protein
MYDSPEEYNAPKIPERFEEELIHLINRHSVENESNTPDFILARYISGCLRAFIEATQQREKWHGREPKPFHTR